MVLADIENTLLCPKLEQNWRDTLAEWNASTPEQVDQILSWAIALRDQFVQAARIVDDPQTLDMVAAIRYIELKSHWILLNTQINYLTVCTGETDFSMAYRASLISQLLGAMEPLIAPDDVDRIILFLSQPMATGEAIQF